MRVVQTVIAVAILVVLSFIAYDLHRVAGELAPVHDITAGVLSLGEPSSETHAQRVERLRRQSADADEYWRSFAEANGIKPPSTKRSPH